MRNSIIYKTVLLASVSKKKKLCSFVITVGILYAKLLLP